MARPSNRALRRAQIVQGLLRVLPERGYERATVQRIAEAAGLSPGLVHHHFENKQAILLALGAHLAEVVEARVRPGESARARLHAFIDAHLALGDGAAPDAVACWVAIGAEALFQPEVGALYRSVLGGRRERLRGLLDAACREEGRAPARLDVAVATLLAATEGFFQLAATATDLVPPGSAASAVRDLADRLVDAMPLEVP